MAGGVAMSGSGDQSSTNQLTASAKLRRRITTDESELEGSGGRDSKAAFTTPDGIRMVLTDRAASGSSPPPAAPSSGGGSTVADSHNPPFNAVAIVSKVFTGLGYQINELAATLHFDLYFCFLCLGSFVCPPLFLPFLFRFTRGHRLFLIGTNNTRPPHPHVRRVLTLFRALGLSHVCVLTWPLVLINAYSFLVTTTEAGQPIVWSVRECDRIFPILSYGLLMSCYALKYSFLDQRRSSSDRRSAAEAMIATPPVPPSADSAASPTAAVAAATAVASSTDDERAFHFIETNVMPPHHQNPIYAFNSSRESFTIKRSFIYRWFVVSRVASFPHLFFSPLYRYFVLAATDAAAVPHSHGGVGSSAGTADTQSPIAGWLSTWFGTAHSLYCCIGSWIIVSQLNFLILETFEFFLLRLRCIERFNGLSAAPLTDSASPHASASTNRKAHRTAGTSGGSDVAALPRSSSENDAKSAPPPPLAAAAVAVDSPPAALSAAASFDWRSTRGLRFWFAVRTRTLQLFQIRFAGLQAVTGLLLVTGSSLLFYLVLQRSKLGNAFLFNDIACRCLLDIAYILFFVFLLVQVSAGISGAREEQARILTEKRCELSFDESVDDNTRLQSTLATMITHVKETNEPPTVLGLKVNSGLSDKIVGLAVLALVNVFSDVLSFFHVPNSKEIASAAIPLGK